MSLNKRNLIRKIVRELIKQELDEANSTASVGGSYNTPHAFSGSNKKGKKKGKAGYTKGHEEPTRGTGLFVTKDPKLRKEGKYHDYRNDDSMTPRQKIGKSMREVRDKLNELEKVVGYNIRLKSETNTPASSYWKNTIKAIAKIDERLKRLSLKMKEMT